MAFHSTFDTIIIAVDERQLKHPSFSFWGVPFSFHTYNVLSGVLSWIMYYMSDDMGMDFDGDMMMRVGNNMAMDMDSGELHMVTGWDDDDNDHGFHSSWDDDNNGFGSSWGDDDDW